MSITVYINFSRALTNVVITDVRSGDKTPAHSVAANVREEFKPDDFNGEAIVRVTSGEHAQGEATLRNGETYLYPPTSRSTLDEAARFDGLGELACEIDRLIKNTTSNAKPSRAKASASAPEGIETASQQSDQRKLET